VHLERQGLGEHREGRPYAVAGEASRERVEAGDLLVQPLTEIVVRRHGANGTVAAVRAAAVAASPPANRTSALTASTTPPRSSAVTRCRACDSSQLVPFLDLGETPVANALLRAPEDVAPVFPLQVGVCTSCTLAQLLHVLPAEDVFDETYPYFSSFSDSLDQHSRQHVQDLEQDGRAGAGRFVVEVASNDGYLLRHLLPLGTRVLGIEPSPLPAAAAEERGIPTLRAFLDEEVARQVRDEHGPADVVLANNVMAHVPDLQGFVRALATLAGDEGIVQVENPGVRWLIEHVEFDTVYHEHYCYFSTTAVARLAEAQGLHLNDVELFPSLQGGTLRWTLSRRQGRSARAEQHLREEVELGLTGTQPYLAFGDRVRGVQDALRALLSQLRAAGPVAAYGAAAKGATLLNSTGIGAETIDFVVDRNPHKQGLWIPGATLPVLDPAALLERQPRHVLVLAWNYVDEVRRQQAAYEAAGGRFVVPVPQPRVLPPLEG
jgi:SAM-dependent methyltransferase